MNPSAGASSKTSMSTRPASGISHTKSASVAGNGTFQHFNSFLSRFLQQCYSYFNQKLQKIRISLILL